MHSYADTIIPNYAFEPEGTVGNAMFRINRNDCIVNYRKSDFLVPHRKNYYFMAFVKAGSSRHWIDMKPYVTQPNTFYFTVPSQVNLKEESNPMNGAVLTFTDDFLATDQSGSLKQLPIIQNLHNGHELVLNPADVSYIDDVLEKLIVEYNTRSYMQHHMLLAQMNVLLIYLSRLYVQQFGTQQPSQERQVLKNYLSKIDKHYTKKHEVADYASLLNLSAGHLSEVVKEQSGKSAITHIHDRLVLEARRLLFHTDYSVKEIAFQLGFEDASYFNRFFKRLVQHTPVDYRTSIRKMYH